MIGIKNTE